MPLNDDDKAELVAYLDGELDELATQAVEAKIASDPETRAELDALKQTWGMLDFLPKTSPSPNFTHRTMERLTLERVGSSKTMPISEVWSVFALTGWGVLILVAVLGGYFAVLAFKPDPTRQEPIPDDELAEWIAGQPKSIRDQWDMLDRKGRIALAAKIRTEERERHEQWALAKLFWSELRAKQALPCRLTDLSADVRDYVENYLSIYMSPEEKEQLSKAQGRWPDYPAALVQIASKRPSALPPPRAEELPRKFSQLPIPIQHRFLEKLKGGGFKPKPAKDILNAEGPTFVSKIIDIAFTKKTLPSKGFGHEFWACNFNSLEKPMQKFVNEQLIPAIKDNVEDQRKLTDSNLKWPDYPLTIQDLSRKYSLPAPPWHYLPEPQRWHWDHYRNIKSSSWGFETAKEKKG